VRERAEWVEGPRGHGGRLPALLALSSWLTFACGDDDSPRGRTDDTATGSSPAPKLAPVAKIETTDAWLNLIAQRPSAVLFREGRLWIDLGHPSALKHVQLAAGASPWRLAQDLDDRRAAVVVGHGGALDVPLDGPLSPALHPDTPWVPTPGAPVPETPPPPTAGLALAITLKALAPDQSVTVLWEERPLANLRIGPEWERRTLSLPHDLVVTGENRLRLHFRNLSPEGGPGVEPTSEDAVLVSAAVESVEVGPLEVIRGEGPDAKLNDYEFRSVGDEVDFEIPADRSLVYYLVPPRRARLRFTASGRGSLVIRASTDADHRHGRAPTELLQQPLRPDARNTSVDLSGYGGLPLRLEIAVRSTRARAPGEPPAGVSFSALDVVANRATPVDRRDRKARDVYVLALEGVRPDDLVDGAFGAFAKGPRYPNFERFLAESLVFERAYALGPSAVPTHASLLTSVVPPGHLTVRGTYVAEGQTSLAEALDRAGYFNSNISANSSFTPERGLTQGFADHLILERSNTRGNDAQKVVLEMLDELTHRSRPLFIYAVLNDAQAPYDPPSDVLTDVIPPIDAPAQHRTHMWVGRVRSKTIEPDRAQIDYVRRLYRGELQVIDQALGVLLDALAERGELDEAVIVLVGIHGEEFLEHGGAGHDITLFEESIHVPLAMRAPKLLAPGRVEVPIDLLDLAPTLADLLGLGYEPNWQGESLVPLIDDPTPPPRLVVSYQGDGSRAAIVGDYKFVLGPGQGRESQHFYDLDVDPSEHADILVDGGVALRVVRTALAWELPEQPRWSRARWGTGVNLQPAFALDHGL
jgi:arylsulfatase A-like enzyme